MRSASQTKGAVIRSDIDRLAPYEITALLETGAVSATSTETLKVETAFAFDTAEHPPVALMYSLVVFYAQHPAACKAHLVCFWPVDQPEKRGYLIGIRLDAGVGDSDIERIARESAAVMLDVPPDLSADLMMFKDDDDGTLQIIQHLALPFYERSVGERLIAPASCQPM